MIQKVWNQDWIEDRIQLRAIQLRRPLSCVWELTYRCNFQCKMCYVRMTDAQAARYGRMRTVDEWLDMGRQLVKAGVLYLTLTGGECTLYPGFETLYEQLSKMGFRLNIMSNAGAYTDSVRELFRRYPPQNAAITLYGGSNETYEAVTGDPKGFEKVIENIRFFQSIGVRVVLNFTIVRANVRDYPKVDKLCQELGVSCTLITDITAHNRDASFSDAFSSRLSPAQRACVACHPPDEVETALKNAEELEKELEHFQLPTAPATPLPAQSDPCIGSYTGSAILWNGEMQTCISMNGYHPVKPFETGFEAAWAQLKAEESEIFRLPSVCQACSLRSECLHNCSARRFEGTGSPFEPDPYTCQYTYLLKLYKDERKVDCVPETPPCP